MDDKQSVMEPMIEAAKLVDLLLAVWRTKRRAERLDGTPEPVRLACESALDRIRDLGFRLDEMVGQAYHEHMRVRIVDQEGDTDLRISECLVPAVYFNGELLRPAEVVVVGSTIENGQNSEYNTKA